MIQRILAALGVMAIAATSLLAGEGTKCTYSTQECLDMMSAKLKSSGWVGIEYEPDPNAKVGYVVTKVVPQSPAEAAGIQTGDILYALNGVKLVRDDEASKVKARREWKPGQSITYTIKRAGEDREVTLTLAPMPADVMARWIGEHMLEHAKMERASTASTSSTR